MTASNRLRIAFVADTLHSHAGGGVASGEYVLERLRRDHDVVSVATDGDQVLPGFQLPLRAMRDAHFVMARPDRSVLAHAFKDVDVVHLQLPFWLSFAALDEAKKLGLPVVAGFHVQPENALFGVGVHIGWLNEVIYNALVKRFYNRVDAVICPTKFAQDKLMTHGLHSPSYVVSNGVPPDVAEAMKQREPSAARRQREPGGKFFILAVGRLAAEKRQDLIIEAIRLSKHARDIRVVLSGEGPLHADLTTLALGLPNGAEIGFLSRVALLDAFSDADLFIHAGEVELEGMSVLESMSAGLPALIADAKESAASAFALNDRFKFPAGDAAALSAKIDWLIDNPEVLEESRKLYRLRAQTFDFDASVRKLLDIYRGVVDRERRDEPLDRMA